MNYKCLSISSQVEYDIQPNLIYSSAIIIADINEDKRNELVIGTGNGEILIYNGVTPSNPWLKSPKQIGCVSKVSYRHRLINLVIHFFCRLLACVLMM